MKKVMNTMLMLLAVLTASAQGEWQKTMTEADELKGEKARTVYIFSQQGVGDFIVWDFNDYQFRLVSEELFNTEAGYSRYTGSYAGQSILIGLYDDNSKLIEKFTLWLDKEDNKAGRFLRTRDRGTMNNPVGQKKKVKKMFTHLLSGSGYVRIVAERYNNTDFDLKITPFNITE